jgi:ABC-type transporter Mla maintaining outer membrane lipid asymmetry ATPase subunit MlaF
MSGSSAVVEMTAVRKTYGAMRPLRIQSLSVAPAERVAIAGIDAMAAELMVNLITGASVPDEGEVRIFGRRTVDVTDGEEWLSSLDRFGIVSDRGVLLEGATLAQNLALPFTLEIDPVSAATRERLVRLAEECGIAAEWLDQPAAAVPPDVRVRAHLARAIALGPELLLMEHPTATLPVSDRLPFGEIVERVCEARALTTVMFSMDVEFASAAAGRVLTLEPATGALKDRSRKGWFGF